MSCAMCTDPDGAACFPQYGLAPHSHAYDSAGRVQPGRTAVTPREVWPTNFQEDPPGSGHGLYWCPYCGDGKPTAALEKE